jgi:hypothetical protein
MGIDEVSRNLYKFSRSSQMAWRQLDVNLQVEPKLTMEDFLVLYRDQTLNCNIEQ